MNTLGSLSQMYMFILLMLLFLGSGFALWGFINFLISRKTTSKRPIVKEQRKVTSPTIIVGNENSTNKKTGGYIMNNNGWIKLAVFSFVGIIVSVVVLGFISTGSNQSVTSHQGVNTTTQATNMQMQGNTTGMTNDQIAMQQQLAQMQQNMMLMQQQLATMQSGAGASMPTTGNMSAMPAASSTGMMDSMMTMMGGMMGMMSNMPADPAAMPAMPAAMPAATPAPMPAMPMM